MICLAVVAGCRDDIASPTPPEPLSATQLAATATTLAFSVVSAGFEHACALTVASQAYCWGWNEGALGDGTTPPRYAPVPVTGGLVFRQISSGTHFTCGVTTDYRAFCWGGNDQGELGDGTTTSRTSPVPVKGGLRFRQVSAGHLHACAVTYPDSRAYCWGYNNFGQLGDNSIVQRLDPVPVLQGRQFHQVSAGGYHSCGLMSDSRVFCWGHNGFGQLGDNTKTSRAFPQPVYGGHLFRQMDAGMGHTCAVTTDNQAFCWGNGRLGQLGNGEAFNRARPVPVSGGLRFTRLTAGMHHTCAESMGGRAYCWGGNNEGEVGTGATQSPYLTPVAVAGGLAFNQVSAGARLTCGKTAGSVLYCWGGLTGDGTDQARYAPVRVAEAP